MDWSKGFTAAFHASIVDVETWRDYGNINITGGSVTRSEAELRESADLNCVNYDQTQERYVRVYLTAEQNGANAHVPIFTGLAVSPDKDINGLYVTNSVACYSVLKPAKDVLLQRGWYAGKGRRGGELIEQLLDATPAPKVIESGSPKLASNIVAGQGESNLSMALKILDAIDWRLRIDGDGTIHIEPKTDEVIARFDNLQNDSIEPKLKVKYDWFKCPNVFRAVSGDKAAVARDSNAIESRGREIWAEDTSPAFNGSETLTNYAKRKLAEAQQVAYSISYDRRFHPDVNVGDLIEITQPAQGISGVFVVKSQSITIGNAGRTSEEVSLYTGEDS